MDGNLRRCSIKRRYCSPGSLHSHTFCTTTRTAPCYISSILEHRTKLALLQQRRLEIQSFVVFLSLAFLLPAFCLSHCLVSCPAHLQLSTQRQFRFGSSCSQVAGHSIQISSNQLIIDEAISSTGTHELSGGVTVQYSESSFTIRGPASASTGQRGEVRGYRQGWSTTSMPTGFFYNIYALLPNSHAEAATGLCTGQDTCPDLFEANQMIESPRSLFSTAEVSHLNQVCCGCYAPTIAIFC